MDQAAQVDADLGTIRCLAWAWDCQHAVAALGVVYMDGHEAALVVEGIEKRQLLVAMHDVGGVVDIQGDGPRRARIASLQNAHHRMRHEDQRAQAGAIFPARHRGLRREVIADVWQSPASSLNAGSWRT